MEPLGGAAGMHEEERLVVSICLHYWVLASPGAAAEGTCKRCGASRQFDGGDVREARPAGDDGTRPFAENAWQAAARRRRAVTAGTRRG